MRESARRYRVDTFSSVAKVFAFLASYVMIVVGLSPVVEPTAASEHLRMAAPAVADEGSDGGSPSSRSASAPRLLNESTDSPGGPSPSPGEARFAYQDAIPVASVLPGEVLAPRLENVTDEYRYETVAGRYAFPKAAPFLMRYESREGAVLVTASTFVVVAPGLSPFRDAQVLDATDYRYRVRYSIIRHGKAVGNVTIMFEFRDDGPPKASAELQEALPGSLSLMWVTFTVDTVIFNGAESIDFRSITPPREVPSLSRRVHVGPGLDPPNWARRTVLNWSDAPGGTSFAGRFAVEGLEGAAVVVRFPEGEYSVDPSIVGTSSTDAATNHSIQRKAFVYGDRWWVFWYDGSNIVYSSSREGTAGTWTAAASIGSGLIAHGLGFDVDQRDGTVIVGYVPTTLTSFRILKGTVLNDAIAWTGPLTVDNWADQGAGPPSMTLGTDGYLWAGVTVKVGAGARLRIYRSTGPGLTAFTTSRDDPLWQSGDSAAFAVRLVPQPNGGVVYIWTADGSSDYWTRRFWQGGWMTYASWTGLPSECCRAELLSAVAGKDGGVHIVHRGQWGGMMYTFIDMSDQKPFGDYIIDSGAGLSAPAVALDANGQVHAFWLFADSTVSPPQYWIRYRRQLVGLGGTWSVLSTPWNDDIEQRRGLTAGPFADDLVFLAWTRGDAYFSVYFGALPTPADLGSQTGEPWNRQGLSPYASYFQHLSEYVSTGNGLLTVKQTDLVLPGRGLDLEIARVLVTPRAFTVGGGPVPYLFEEYPAANLGYHWRLNFPWLSSQYLHLWDGQMYVVEWSGNEFENHEGEHFVLTRTLHQGCSCYSYALDAKHGVRYQFDSNGRLRNITDPSGNSTITVDYDTNGIGWVNDTIGRSVVFDYNADGTLASVSSGPLRVEYGYTVMISTKQLTSVRDTLGRETRFEYDVTRLLAGVEYPTGGKSVFSWSNPVPIGPDVHAYYVTLQDVLNSTGQSLRAYAFDYEGINGRVSYVNVTTYDAGVVQGYFTQNIDALARNVTTVRQNASFTRMGKEVVWLGWSGAPEQTDVYAGASPVPSHSTYGAFDEWGNEIYSRDAIGHERFASFANTRHEGGFYAPPRLGRTVSGLRLFDDFEDRDLSDWSKSGSVTLDAAQFLTLPPVMRLHATSGSTSASAEHSFQATLEFRAEATVRPEENNRDHHIRVRAGSSDRVDIRFAGNGWIQRKAEGGAWIDLMQYSPQVWYRVTLSVRVDSGYYDIFVDGVQKLTGQTLPGSGTPDRIAFEALSCSGCTSSTFFVDSVKVWRWMSVYLTQLPPNGIAQYHDRLGRKLATERASSGSLYLAFDGGVDAFPYGTIAVYDEEWNLEYISPTHDFWGGDTWTYTPSWRNASLARTRSGFLRYTTVFLDDDSNKPSATYDGATDGWNWGSYDLPMYGAQSHRSPYRTAAHNHSFYDANPGWQARYDEFYIQYVFIPENMYPAGIIIGVNWTDIYGWEDGWDYYKWGYCPAGAECDWPEGSWPMGGIPGPSGRWLMLIVEEHVRYQRTEIPVHGFKYKMYGGQASWDFTAKGDNETGMIQVTGLQAGWTAVLTSANGARSYSAVVPSGSSTAKISVCCPLSNASRDVAFFPFEGRFTIRNGTNLVYRSPVFSLWGGDIYTYTASDFYSDNVKATIHDRPAGILEYQTGRDAPPLIAQDAYFDYTENGWPSHQKVRDGMEWRVTSVATDTWGRVTEVDDPLQNRTSLAYSSEYGQAYMTQVTDDLGNTSRFDYDSTTGWLLGEKNPRGFRTLHEYDSVGRPTMVGQYDLASPEEELHFDMDWMTEDATPMVEDISGKGNHGTVFGTSVVEGKVGKARHFDGAGDYIEANDSASLDIDGSNLTLTAWVYPEGSTSARVILSKEGSYAIAVNWGFFQAAVDTTTPGGWAWGGGFDAPLAKWTHVAFVYESGTTWKFYINGVLRETRSPMNGQTGPIQPSDEPLRVGDRTSQSEPFLGIIDEVRVFSRALPDSEVAALFDNSFGLLQAVRTAYDDGESVVTTLSPGTTPRLLHLDMESTISGRLEDLAGRGFHATLFNTTQVAGIHGAARHFDGTAGDYIAVPDGDALDPTLAITVSAWVRPEGNHAGGFGGVWFDQTIASRSRILVADDGSVTAQFRFSGMDRSFSTAPGLVPLNQWSHVVYTYTDGWERIYVNAVERASEQSFGPLSTSSLPRLIGRGYNYEAGSYFFNGSIDEVQVFDRALGPEEISGIYHATENGAYDESYFDSLGRLTREVRRDLFSSLASTDLYSYNSRDSVTSHTSYRDSATSFTTTFEYDFLGRPTKATYPGTPAPATVTYDDVNRVRTVVPENGRKVQYGSDLGGRTTAVREYHDPTGYYTTSFAYDEAGNLLELTDAGNRITRHAYDNLNRLINTTYPDPTKYEAYTYDAIGNLKSSRDRAGNVTAYVYDDMYRLVSIDHPEDAEDVDFTYDPNDNPQTVTNPTAAVSYAYDGLDRVKTEMNVISGVGYPVDYEYDAAGHLSSLIYPPENPGNPGSRWVVTYEHDPLGRTSGVKSGSTTFAAFSYYADSMVKNMTLGNGITESYAFTGRGWPTTIRADHGAENYMDLAYTYDDSGNVLTMDSDAFTYDQLDRLKNASGGFGNRVYAYDGVGNRASEQGSVLSADLRPNANGDFQEWSQTPPFGPHYDKVNETPPDGDARYVYARIPGGQRDLYQISNLGSTLGGATIDYVKVSAMGRYVGSNPWDFGTIQLLVITNGALTNVGGGWSLTSGYMTVSWTLPLNPVTNQPWTLAEVNALQVGVLLVQTSYEVRVTQLYATVHATGSTSYGYDTLGMNQLISMTRFGATTSFGYDANGNLRSKSTPGAPSWSYEWNFDNLMTRAVKSGVQQQAYFYDGLGRRANVTGSSSATWTVSAYAGHDTIFERDQSGAVTEYVRANGMLVAKIAPSDAVVYYLGDHLGSTTQVRDSSRNLVFSATYDPFGKSYEESGTETYRYAGEKHDDPTSLVHLRARQYDPDIGRFVSADPLLGFPADPQSLNRYSYVGNNPLKYTDPSGLCFGCSYYDFPIGTNPWSGGYSNLNPNPQAAGLAFFVFVGFPLAVAAGAVCGGCPLWAGALVEGATWTGLDITSAALSGEGITWQRIALDFALGAGGYLGGVAISRGLKWLASQVRSGARNLALEFRLWRRSGELATDGGTIAKFNTKTEALSFVRRTYPPGGLRSSFTKFFGGATGKTTKFEFEALAEGGYRLSFYSPARTPGWGKLYVQVLDEFGGVIMEYKDIVDPAGLLFLRKWLHGGP